MLPVPVLPVPTGIGYWDWQYWILATFDQLIDKWLIDGFWWGTVDSMDYYQMKSKGEL